MPAPKFEAPSPGITRPEETEWQWWHISVGVKQKLLRRDIPGCRIYVAFLDGQYVGQEFPFRWRSDLPSGSSETTLISGVLRKIPLVVRRDKAQTATLTDHDSLTRNMGDYVIPDSSGETLIIAFEHYYDEAENHNLKPLNPGPHKIILKIKSGVLCWESNPYIIRVPDSNASNSHFNVESEEPHV